MKITATRNGYAVSCAALPKIQDSMRKSLERMLVDDLDRHEMHNKGKLSGATTEFTYTED